MTLDCQSAAMSNLQELASHDAHSVLIEGPSGCGKTYLAKEYAKLLGIPDFQVIESTVPSIRFAIEQCLNLSNNIVICIENLDEGVVQASYVLLKFLEEPNPNVYVVVTCSNRCAVPDTIVSRSACISISVPTSHDLEMYAKELDLAQYEVLKANPITRSVKTFGQLKTLFGMNIDQLTYVADIGHTVSTCDSVSDAVWKLGHYPDGSATPLGLVIGYIIDATQESNVRKAGLVCARELSQSRIASHAILAKFIFEWMYGG